MDLLLLVAMLFGDTATFQHWSKECATHRSLRAQLIQCFSAAMAVQLPLEETLRNNAAFHIWMKECLISRSLQAGTIRCFFAMMVLLCLAAGTPRNGRSLLWIMACHTHRFPRACIILCFSKVMVLPLPVAKFTPGMKMECHTHTSFCRQFFHGAARTGWSSFGLWRQHKWTMQYSTLGCGNILHSDFCRWAVHTASPKWWLRCCLRSGLWWAWHLSSARAWNLLRQWVYDPCRRPCLATRSCLRGSCSCAHVLGLGWWRSAALECD